MPTNKISSLDIQLKQWIDHLKNSQGVKNPEDRWLSVPETCLLLRCSEITFYRKCKSGEINYSKPSSIMVWISDIAKFVINKESFKKVS
ncbi:MAG: helix-turn-helix domain-containing protein [Fluviicola sp.]|nr:helix-turn-helix domain-containing protein [Fluviicola sp.]